MIDEKDYKLIKEVTKSKEHEDAFMAFSKLTKYPEYDIDGRPSNKLPEVPLNFKSKVDIAKDMRDFGMGDFKKIL